MSKPAPSTRRTHLEGEDLFERRPAHDPGRVLVDLATTLIDRGDCVSDLGALADKPDPFDNIASHATAARRLFALADDERVAHFL